MFSNKNKIFRNRNQNKIKSICILLPDSSCCQFYYTAILSIFTFTFVNRKLRCTLFCKYFADSDHIEQQDQLVDISSFGLPHFHFSHSHDEQNQCSAAASLTYFNNSTFFNCTLVSSSAAVYIFLNGTSHGGRSNFLSKRSPILCSIEHCGNVRCLTNEKKKVWNLRQF